MSNILQKTLIIAIAAIIAFSAQASNFYAENSVLAQGRWVKIKVTDTGIQQITPEDLAKFGFNDPTNVKVFGFGGASTHEELMSTRHDDLPQVATKTFNGSIFFYGISGVNTTIFNTYAYSPEYMNSRNSYSDAGYYFLTDDSRFSHLEIESKNIDSSTNYDEDICFDYTIHETEITNPGRTGKKFLGEDINTSKEITVDMYFPGIIPGKRIIAEANVAVANTDVFTEISMSINGEAVDLPSRDRRIPPISSELNYYNYRQPKGEITLKNVNEKMPVKVKIADNGNSKMARLDYILIGYERPISLVKNEPQARVNLLKFNGATTRLKIKTLSDKARIWYIGSGNYIDRNPTEYKINFTYNPDEQNFIGYCTSDLTMHDWRKFILFDPQMQQHKVQFVEATPNQNLHALPSPDMLIITTKAIMPQAKRLAEFHKQNDGLDVLVVDHQQIFNEFTSGTPDISAYRYFAKMLYDKTPGKLKHLLLFGGGSFDNRGINGSANSNLLLTMQSDRSEEETNSFTTDDLFGMLKENSYDGIAAEKMLIAVGRIPAKGSDDAKIAVDKIINYCNSDFSDWRNNMLIATDEGEKDLFEYQSEGVESLINDSIANPIHINKVYSAVYKEYDNTLHESQAASKLDEMMKSGVIMATYIGHGGPVTLTRSKYMLTAATAKELRNKYLPVMMLATCDVARFDSGERGIGEALLFNPNGGAIALVAAARTVYADENDILNRELHRIIFENSQEGKQITLGEALMGAKNKIGYSNNKLNFFLLGDPAIKLAVPQANIRKIAVNGTPADNGVSVSPMQKFTITAEIHDAGGNTDNSFNGTATARLYDKAKHYKKLTSDHNTEIHDSYIKNEMIAKVDGNVVNGIATIEMLLPAQCLAQNETVTLCIYAHDKISNRICNGATDKITLTSYDPSKAITDKSAPQISEMWINSPEFADGDKISGKATLHIAISDDNALCSQYMSAGLNAQLTLDKKRTIHEAASMLSFNSATKQGIIEIDIDGHLTEGLHTLAFSIADIAGNRAQRSISFYYSENGRSADITLTKPEVRDEADFTITSAGITTPEYTITVTDNNGNKVWSATTSAETYKWNMTLPDGTRLPAGIYNYYVTAHRDVISAGSGIKKLIVVK